MLLYRPKFDMITYSEYSCLAPYPSKPLHTDFPEISNIFSFSYLLLLLIYSCLLTFVILTFLFSYLLNYFLIYLLS